MTTRFLFAGYDTLHGATWSTDGTANNTARVTDVALVGNDVTLAYPSGSQIYEWRLAPAAVFIGTTALFDGVVSTFNAQDNGYAESSVFFVTDGTVPGTHELSPSQQVSPGGGLADITVYNGRYIFAGIGADNVYGIWTSDGTDAGTTEVTVSGSESQGIFRAYSGQLSAGLAGAAVFPDFTAFGTKAYFVGEDANSNPQLWSTDGTSAGTTQLAVANAYSGGLFLLTSEATNQSSPDFTAFGGRLWFEGRDAAGYLGLWSTDGTAAGTTETTIPGAFKNGLFNTAVSANFTVYGGRMLFEGRDTTGAWQLFSTDGTSAGTSEIVPAGAATTGLFTSPLRIDNFPLNFDAEFTPFNGKLLFAGVDTVGALGLWITDGTASGTTEITVAGADANGVSPEFFAADGPIVLFQGMDTNGVFQLWQTDGTSAGTKIIPVPANSTPSTGLQPTDFVALPAGVATPPALPDVSASVTGSAASILGAALATIGPPGTLPSVFTAHTGPVDVDLVGAGVNAWVWNTPASGTTVPVPYLFNAGYLLGSAPAVLNDAGYGNRLLVATAPNATVNGYVGDTIVGGNGSATLVGTGGAETMAGGTGANLFVLLRTTANVFSQGADTILGSTAATTITASGAALYYGQTGATLFNATAGVPTLVGGAAETVVAGAATPLVFGGAVSLDYRQGSGTATVIGGVGSADTLTGGAAPLLYFGNGSTRFTPGPSADTILGGTGSLTAIGGAGNSLLFGGNAGGNRLTTGPGSTTIIGAGSGDVLRATGGGFDVIGAGAGAATVDASASTGRVVLFAGAGADCLIGGAGQVALVAGAGADTLVGSTGVTLMVVAAGAANRHETITGFDASHDFVYLPGYATGAGAAAFAAATTSGGATTLTLPDHTTISFIGGLPASYSFT